MDVGISSAAFPTGRELPNLAYQIFERAQNRFNERLPRRK